MERIRIRSFTNHYKFTYYSPSSNNSWYGDTNYTANSWKVETVSYIPLSSSSTVNTGAEVEAPVITGCVAGTVMELIACAVYEDD